MAVAVEVYSMKKNNQSKKIIIISLIIVSIIIISLVIYFIFFKEKINKEFIGTWNCKYYNEDKLIVKLEINKDNQFIWSKDNYNYILGNYKLEKIDKKDSNKNVKYYRLSLNSEKFIEKNKEQNKEYNKTYDLAINKEEKKIVMTNKDNMTFNCKKINDNNPVIK